MNPIKVVSYCRRAAGRRSLGINVQQNKVLKMAKARGADVVSWFTEDESVRMVDRPRLRDALERASKDHAVLVVAKIYELARDAEFISHLLRKAESKGIDTIWFADLPEIENGIAAGPTVLSVMASLAKFESRRISERTRDALTAAKEQGSKLGGLRPQTRQRNQRASEAAAAESEKLRPTLEALQRNRLSYRAMAQILYDLGHVSRTGEALSPSQIHRHLKRLGLSPNPHSFQPQ